MNDKYAYQFCQKLVIFSKDFTEVLIAKRIGEQDYNNVFSFVGGKMEHADASILAGIKREKDEEVGADFKIHINPLWSYNIFFVKKDGSHMVLPHYFAVYESGEVELSDEYSEFAWAKIGDWNSYESLTENIPTIVTAMLELKDKLLAGATY